MQVFARFITGFIFLGSITAVYAANCGCCNKMGGIHYCDSSARRFVCRNGYYSDCYCERRAVMDLQLLKGCCLWHGGVMDHAADGLVVCNDGNVSTICSIQNVESAPGIKREP